MNNRIKIIANQFYLFVKQQISVFRISLPNFVDYRTTMKASALTYFTLLSVVPFFALIFAISKNLGMEKLLQQELLLRFSGQKEVALWIIHLSTTVLQKAKSGLIAGVGLVILLWAIMRLLMNMENAFNEIWRVKYGRKFSRKVADYFSIIILSPIFLLLAISITIYITTQIESITKTIQYLGFLRPFVRVLINLIPYILVWLLFSIVYKTMPNTQVKFRSALLAGIVAGTLFQVTQWAYVKFQIGVSNLNALYGSFAALPLFMIWVQTAWLIVLFGAQYSFTVQHIDRLLIEKNIENISNYYKKIIAVTTLFYIIKNFEIAKTPPTIHELNDCVNVSNKHLREVLNNLEECNLVVKTHLKDEEEDRYLPATDIHQIKIHHVIEKFDQLGNFPENLDENIEISKNYYENMLNILRANSSNILIKDLPIKFSE